MQLTLRPPAARARGVVRGRLERVREAEVDNLRRVAVVTAEQDVLELEVAVRDALLVQMAQARKDARKERPHAVLCERDVLLDELQDVNAILVDVHAEATSEKQALGWYLDGKVAGVFGTHTHVQTADERILPMGTAFITDAGMTGPYNSVIGMKVVNAIEGFRTQRRPHHEVASGNTWLCGVVVEIDDRSGKAKDIQRIKEVMND